MSRRESEYPRRPGAPRNEPPPPLCAAPGCLLPGDHRAPRSRDPKDGDLRFCLDHVRDYNRNWNWFQGMSQGEIEAYQARNATWHRPTWRLGTNGSGHAPDDPLRILDELGLAAAGTGAATAEPRRVAPEELRALRTLGLDCGATGTDVKRAYKALVKLYHPDHNGGDTATEPRLRAVIEAYRHLRTKGFV